MTGTAARRALRGALLTATVTCMVAAFAAACRGSGSHSATIAKQRPGQGGAGLTVVTGPTSRADSSPTSSTPQASTSPAPTTGAPTTLSPTRAALSTTPPTTAAAFGSSFVGTVATVTASDLGGSWHAGCPVGPDQLRLLRLGYWGFDNAPHVGSMVVNTAVTSEVLKVFAQLFAEHFPIHQMQPVAAYGGSDPASMSADNTSGFNCRYAVTIPPTTQWSVHAFGEAIDVNTVENPYIEGSVITPAAGAAFVDRSIYRPGMAVAGGQLVQAFASAGWQWGGRWSTPDYQHFSKTGG